MKILKQIRLAALAPEILFLGLTRFQRPSKIGNLKSLQMVF
jgi:hypothetical protein